jgi:DNA polymerase I-like protein with 3'-5' exonuclease and polymerase domains
MATLVTRKDQLEEIVARLKTESSLVLDFVNFPLTGQESKIVGLSVAPPSEPDISYIPFVHLNPFEKNELLTWAYVLPHVCGLIDGKKLLGHDLVNISAAIEGSTGTPRFAYGSDVMVEAYVTGKFSEVDLVSLVRVMYGLDLQAKYHEILARNDATIPMSTLFNYACERVGYIRKIHKDLYPQINASPKLKRIFQIEMGVLPIAAEMQENGINVDFEKCESEAIRLMKEADTLSEALHGWLKRNFNIESHFDFGSSPQTAALITDRLHIADEVKTARGNRSTSKKTMKV